jgi:PKHD-type hydroxylase
VSAIVIEGAVSAEVLAQIRSAIAGGPFVSGKQTAVGGAADIKDNLQLALDSPAAAIASELLAGALQSSDPFQAATWADASLTPLFCRYEPGMKYGDHIDGAIMGEAPMLIRCDIAVTVCISDGSSYEGGELVIDAAGASRGWKGNAGDAIVYPADTLHRVNAVKSGVRDVAVFWIQSMIRDAGRRRILFDLKSALDVLDQSRQPAPHVDALRRSYFNLIRMWA